MQVNYLFYIGVAIFSMFFGYFFGLFEGRSQGYKKRKKEEEKEREAQTASETEAQPMAVPVETLPPAPPPSLLRLFQDETGRLRLDLDNQSVDTSALTGEQRKRLIELLTRMRPWLETGKPQPASAPAPASGPTPRPAPVSRPAAPPTPSPLPPPPTVAAKPVIAGPVMPIEPPPEAPESMVTQIDAILQVQLIGTPLENQGIKLRESPEGSVLVHVGSKVYQAVEDVPDEAIKAALRTAIATWEKRFTPGL